jgi:serine/threonine protein kinase
MNDPLAQESAPEQEEDALIGTTFEGKYRIEQKLGDGGMGVVYRATHLMLERPVAIKLLLSNLVRDKKSTERFKREARIAGRIPHPNVTAVLDFGLSQDKFFYLVMEYLEGETLRDRLQYQGLLSLPEVVAIVTQVCDAVDAAHKCSVVHRDLKPENIFLQRKNNGEIVKVLDFGISKFLFQDTQQENNRLTGEALVGTPHYMSPEQCQNGEVGPGSDIYSIGVITFELLTGHLPFWGNSPVEFMLGHMREAPPSPLDFRDDLPLAVEPVIRKVLLKKPEYRYLTGQAFAQDLKKALLSGSPEAVSAENKKTVCANSSCGKLGFLAKGRCADCRSLLVDAQIRNRYRVKRLIGKGGFGTTYLANDFDRFEEPCIIKELSFDNTKGDDELASTAKRLFRREAQVLLNLDHPNIPKLHAFFTLENFAYLVQDFVPGQTLYDQLREQGGALSEVEVRKIVYEIALILEYLHSCEPPVIHRDIKPQNLIRHTDGRLMLLDFGAVYQKTNEGGNTFIASPGYAPPEQICGQAVTKSDLYAAGATAVYLLTGENPHKFFNSKTMQIDWHPAVKVTSEFAAILDQLLNPDVVKRLDSASRLREMLENLGVEPETTLVDEPIERAQMDSELSTWLWDSALSYQEVSRQPYLSEEQLAKSIRGNISATPVVFLLRSLYRQHFTGKLICINDLGVSKTVYFNQGTIVFAHSSVKSEWLSEWLVRAGHISAADYERITTIVEANSILFDRIVVELQILSEERLRPLITVHIASIIYSLFEWTTGRYELGLEQVPEGPVHLLVSTANIIFEGIRRLEDIYLVEKWLGNLSRKFVATTDPQLLYQIIDFTPKEEFIIGYIVGAVSIEELLAIDNMPKRETFKTVCGLLLAGILEWASERNKGNTMALGELLKKRRASTPLPTSPTPLLAAADSTIGSTSSQFTGKAITKLEENNFDLRKVAEFCYEVEVLANTIDNADYYAALGVARKAKLEDIEGAYWPLEEKYNPDKNADLINYNKDLKAQLDKIYRYLRQAYQTLRHPQRRADYDHRLHLAYSRGMKN